MKPLGTITQCFPHVDEETKSILQSVMDEAENYADFVKRLCNKVRSKQVTPVLHYFAFFHAYNMGMYQQIQQLINVDGMPLFIEPLYFANKLAMGSEVDMNVMYKSLKKAMETLPNDWLACHLYLAWRRSTESFDPETDTDVQIMETLRKRIEGDQEFDCFKALLNGLEAFRLVLKGYHSEAVQLFEKSIRLAKKHDDLPLVADGLYFLAERMKHTDPSRAIDLMMEQKKIGEELGYSWALARNHLVLGRINTLRGEYNAALSHLLDYQEFTESIGHPESFSNLDIPLLYNLMERGRKALEYLKNTEGKTDGKIRHSALYHLRFAFAFMNIGDVTKALMHLDIAKQLAVQSGIQGSINFHQLLEGIFEKMKGDFPSAKDTLTTLLERLHRESQLHRNLCLFHLADIEVEEYSSHEGNLTGSWLEQFENHVEERNYPGFAAQAKILRATLFRKIGQHEKSQVLIDEVLEAAEAPSMKYLKKMIAKYLPDISSAI